MVVKRLYVYILLCSDETLYVGVTNNLEKRLSQHNDGVIPNSYTYFRRPCKLMYWEAIQNPNKAIAREKQIKRWSRNKKWALINNNETLLHQLSACKNNSSHKNK